MSSHDGERELEWLGDRLAAEPVAGHFDRSGVTPAELWARGRAVRRRRRALVAAAALVVVAAGSGAAMGVAGSVRGGEQQQFAGDQTLDLKRAAQDALGEGWTLTSSNIHTEEVAQTPRSTGTGFPGAASTRVADVINLEFIRSDRSPARTPMPGIAPLTIQSARYLDPMPTKEQVAAYARRGGAASHEPYDGTNATVLLERTPAMDSHVWVVQMPDMNSLIGVIWWADGRLAQIIEPGGAAPVLDPAALASLAEALARA